MKISIIIPCYNEEKTLVTIVNKVLNYQSFDREIIIIDDCSSDQTPIIIEELKKKYKEITSFKHEKNQGKGAGIRSGIKLATGNIILIQDADLEYSPKDYDKLLLPFLNSDADIVYGSRFLGGDYVRLHFFWHHVANKLLTNFCNIFSNLNMSDMETGYKVFKSEVIKSINLKESSFGIEPEITIKLAKKNFIFYEVPISYSGRSYDEGKKIGLKDAFVAIYCIVKYRFFD
jgi:glycosyltransferase involved in cell wall biosynthesis|tara:strand:+ start:337 stop:1029 length:693 start_codon:yes stop_codon:yes gene_type:complete